MYCETDHSRGCLYNILISPQLLRNSHFSVFSAALRAMCLLLQHCRVNLRLQVEWGLNALMDLFSTETSKMSHIRKEAVLETIVQVPA